MIYGGISLKGSYHEINQDSFATLPYDGGWVLVVSDGMGSKALSQYGSKAVCEAVRVVLNREKGHPKISDFKGFLFRCYDEWRMLIKDFEISQCYATMLITIVTENDIKAARLGDGFIGIYTDMGTRCLYDKKEDYFANETDCLDENFRWDKLEIYECEYKEFFGVIACTDGIEIGTMQEAALKSFTAEFTDKYRLLTVSEINEDIKKWLSDWPGSDDKTLAYIMKEVE